MAGLLDVIQGASNSVAGNVSAPVDGLAWLLRKAGLPIPDAPMGGSDWMAQKGLTAQPQSRNMGLLGEAIGGVAPMLAAAKAPQIARGLLQMGENLAAPRIMNPQAGAIAWPGSPKQVYHGSADAFEKFDPHLLGSNTKASDAGVGFHFSDNKADASLYADMAAREKMLRDAPWLSKADAEDARGVVRAFDLDMKNPLVVGMDATEGNAGSKTSEFLADKWAAKRFATENGFDGLIYPQGTNVDSGYTAIAFEPGQITKIPTQTKVKR